MKDWTKKDIEEESKIVHNLLFSLNKKGGKVNRWHLKEACLTYCSVKIYSEPENKEFWVNVQDYIKNEI